MTARLSSVGSHRGPLFLLQSAVPLLQSRVHCSITKWTTTTVSTAPWARNNWTPSLWRSSLIEYVNNVSLQSHCSVDLLDGVDFADDSHYNKRRVSLSCWSSDLCKMVWSQKTVILWEFIISFLLELQVLMAYPRSKKLVNKDQKEA